MTTFKIAAGFHAELVAAEPMVDTPVAMSWDDRGRMFVCEMRGYMHDVEGAGEDQPLGRIVLEAELPDVLEAFVDNFLKPGNLAGGFAYYRAAHAGRIRMLKGEAVPLPPIEFARIFARLCE